ncbi:hypothetical protein AAMO2058_001728300 [Amorphochlora amoebiformis]
MGTDPPERKSLESFASRIVELSMRDVQLRKDHKCLLGELTNAVTDRERTIVEQKRNIKKLETCVEEQNKIHFQSKQKLESVVMRIKSELRACKDQLRATKDQLRASHDQLLAQEKAQAEEKERFEKEKNEMRKSFEGKQRRLWQKMTHSSSGKKIRRSKSNSSITRRSSATPEMLFESKPTQKPDPVVMMFSPRSIQLSRKRKTPQSADARRKQHLSGSPSSSLQGKIGGKRNFDARPEAPEIMQDTQCTSISELVQFAKPPPPKIRPKKSIPASHSTKTPKFDHHQPHPKPKLKPKLNTSRKHLRMSSLNPEPRSSSRALQTLGVNSVKKCKGVRSSSKKSTSTTDPSPKMVACLPTVRKKAERQSMPGFACSECEEWYKMVKDTVADREALLGTTFCNHVSRHRRNCEIPKTPPGYWAIGLSEDSE